MVEFSHRLFFVIINQKNFFISCLRSLGCVLYELIFLEVAFPQGQRDDPPIPNFAESGLFLEVLSKYFNLF